MYASQQSQKEQQAGGGYAQLPQQPNLYSSQQSQQGGVDYAPQAPYAPQQGGGVQGGDGYAPQAHYVPYGGGAQAQQKGVYSSQASQQSYAQERYPSQDQQGYDALIPEPSTLNPQP